MRFCIPCDRYVTPARHLDAGFWLLVLVTSGLWLFAIPLYKPRCPMCNSVHWGNRQNANA